MDTQSIEDGAGDDQTSTSQATIEVPIPAIESDLYRYSATDTLLTFLFDRPFSSYSIRELASVTDTTHRTVSKAVHVLEQNDMVVVEQAGNKKQVQINRERINKPADPVLRIPQAAFQPPVRAAIDELLDELESVIGIQVYGSVARGEADRRSDIDLWVLVQENRSRNQRRANDVANELGDRQFDGDRYEFHIVVEAPNSLPQFTEDIAHIVASGIPVYETDEYDQFRAILEDLIDE